MRKKIVFVGRSVIDTEDTINLKFKSDRSLFDGDIIVFSIDTSGFYSHESFQDLTCLDDDSSFRLKNDCAHWRSELNASLTEGKTVIVYLNSSAQFAVATGEKRFSGTGRNARTTRIVTPFDPYDEVIPAKFGSVVRRSGERIKAAGDLGILATYWQEFGGRSTYEAYIDSFKGSGILETQAGGKTVGGILRLPNWKGTLILLPAPDLESVVNVRAKALNDARKRKPAGDRAAAARQEESNRKKAKRSIEAEFLAALVGIDKAARSASEVTPPPTWSGEDRFELAKESELRSKIDEVIARAEALRREKESLMQALRRVQRLKGLLYEKGKPLEGAILTALNALGFKAENFKEGDSEFDAVVTDPEGARFIGEAEGKDDKAINVDKLDQLDRNLKEDFSRQEEEAAQYATGILFGNAHRLTDPDGRAAFFTPKCILAAKRSHIRLVKTPDLFKAAKHLDDHPDAEFAARCRQSIKAADGEIVVFPAVPKTANR